MNAMTCQEVEEQLDLLAAGVCDEPERQSIERHLRTCPACTASFRESQRLMGLLDLQLNETGPAKLRRRIEQEDRRMRHRPVVLPFIRRAMAVAAMLLLTVMLVRLPLKSQLLEPEVQMSALVLKDDAFEKAQPALVRTMPEIAPMFLNLDAAPVVLTVPAGELGEAFRGKLREGKLPLPTAVPLVLALTTAGNRQVELRLSEVALRVVPGDGVIHMAAPGAVAPAVFEVQPLKVVPGKPTLLRIERLIAGAPGRLKYIYLTEPREYTVTARLRLTAGNGAVTERSGSIRVKVATP